MMYIQGENEIFFLDRDNSVFEVESLKFFHRKNLDHHLKDTLLDGVITLNKNLIYLILLFVQIFFFFLLGNDY